MKRRLPRLAFTLVELLVVIAIIGILVALLLPAVQQAREAARRLQCQNNFKQAALALHNYHDSYNVFPPAMTFKSGEDPTTYNTPRMGWTISILPQMEQQSLFDLFDLSQPLSSSGRNQQARSTQLPTMLCPSEPNGKVRCNRAGGDWARGSIGANVGLVNPKSTAAAGAAAGSDQWIATQRGVLGPNGSLNMGEIKDGTSNTFLLMELRVGLAAQDIRGTWAMAQCGANAVCSHGINASGGGGPNTCVEGADDQQDSGGVNSAIGDARAKQECMYLHASNNWQAFPRSNHEGGVFVALCDGSIRFISDYIETGGNAGGCCISCVCNPTTYGTWQRMIVSGDGLVVDGSKF